MIVYIVLPPCCILKIIQIKSPRCGISANKGKGILVNFGIFVQIFERNLILFYIRITILNVVLNRVITLTLRNTSTCKCTTDWLIT